MQYRIRDAEERDLPAVREVVYAVGREFGYEPEPEGADVDLHGESPRYFEGGSLFRVLVDDDDRVRGMLGVVVVDADTVELRKIYLAPDARGGGYGRRLLDEAIEHARARGAKRMILESASRLERAIEMYERAGFRDVQGGTRSTTCDRRMELLL